MTDPKPTDPKPTNLYPAGLKPANLATIATGPAAVPLYDRSALRPSIVHLGVGGFHRAHLATYVDDLARAGHTDWAIIGAGVLPGDAAMDEALKAQDCLYTLVSRGADDLEATVIGSIVDYLHAHPSAEALIERIASPTTQIVSMTVTEGGYPIDNATGGYRADSTNAGPDTAFGILARGIDRRRRLGGEPLTVISCDNILSNGEVARTSLQGEAAIIGDDLVAWIDANVSFPNSMVDRITPATTPTDRTWVAEHLGIDDRWPVMAEPFRQWVIEDRFAGDRLPLEDIDVIVTDDVEPYEHMKLRLLNAGHSALCYLAALEGYELVDRAMADPVLGAYERAILYREAKPVVEPVKGIDLDDYVADLMERFANPCIGDQIERLCLDGSAKFPKFLLPTIERQLAIDGPIELAVTALAGWCEYLNGVDQRDNPITPAGDPLRDEAIAHAHRSRSDPAAFCDFDSVFGPLGRNHRFRQTFADILARLRRDGVSATVESLVAKPAP